MINDVNRIQFFCNAAPKRQQCYFSTFWAQFSVDSVQFNNCVKLITKWVQL